MTMPTSESVPLLNYNDNQKLFGDRRIWFHPTWNRLHLGGVGRGFDAVLTNLTKDKWYFFGFSYDKGAKKLYAWMDGEIVNTWTNISSEGNFDRGIDGDLILGIYKLNKTAWGGSVACLFVYADALSVADVKSSKDRCTQTSGECKAPVPLYRIHFRLFTPLCDYSSEYLRLYEDSSQPFLNIFGKSEKQIFGQVEPGLNIGISSLRLISDCL